MGFNSKCRQRLGVTSVNCVEESESLSYRMASREGLASGSEAEQCVWQERLLFLESDLHIGSISKYTMDRQLQL